MEKIEILNELRQVLNNSTVSKFVERKWNKMNDISGGQCSASQNIRFKTSMLRLDASDYSDE